MAPAVPPQEVFSSSRRWPLRPAVVLALAAALSCGGDETIPPDPPEPARVTVSPSSLEFAALRDTARLSAQVHDQYGGLMADAAVTWASSDASVAPVDGSGLVTAAGNGAATITATAGSASGTAAVTVAQVASSVGVSPAALEFSALGDTLRLAAEPVDANGYPVEGATVRWASGDTAVAVVDPSGLVRSVGNGEAVVTATAGSVSGTAEVMVAQVVTAVTVSPEALEFSALGDTLQLGAEPVDANGHAVEGATVMWASGDTTIAVVDPSGLVRSVGNGEATVTATAGSASDSAQVTVAQVASVVGVSPGTARLTILGATLQLAAEATDENGHRIAEPSFTWASDALAVAAVDAAGLVQAVGYGVATVTATLDSASGSAEIRVEEDLERAALIALYEATNGPNWRRSQKWLTDAPIGEWQGVEANAEGRVVRLRLQSNSMAGPLPAELANLTSLRSLQLQGNGIAGVMPPWLGGLRLLEDLHLVSNRLTGAIPPELGELAELQFLGLCLNDLTGPIPPELGNLSNLTILSFCENDLSGSIPPELGDLPNLIQLNLSGNNLTGPIPPELGKMSSLEWLWLGHNRLTGELPPELGDLPRLESFDLESNSVAGPIPRELGRLSRLARLDLGFNALTGPIPPELGNLAALEWLDFERNPVSGPIPPELGNLSKLNTLILSDTKLVGPIPREIGRLSRLEQLIITHNDGVTGPIPPELGDLPLLRVLDLRLNDLTGQIPSELGAALGLRALVLRGNRLSGPIPPGLGDAPELARLEVDHNELSGPVPPEIGNIESLTHLDLTGNTEMGGPLPIEMTALHNLDILLTGETALCAPNDPDFRGWLRNIGWQRVPECAPMPAYLVQSVQSREFPVPLVAGEPALLRVFVTAREMSNATIPTIVARFYRDDMEVHTDTIPGKSVSIPTEVDEGDLSKSSNAEIPASVIRPGLEMVIEVDPDSTLDPELGVAKRIPATGRAVVDVSEMPLFDLTVVPLLWEENPDSSVLDLTENMTADDTLFGDTHMLLPVGEMEVTVHESVVSSTNDIFTLLTEVTALRALEGGTRHYMGMIMNPEGAGGVAHAGGGWTTVARPNARTMAHELGHNMSLLHAPCGGTQLVDRRYPYLDGSVGAWGYDPRSETVVPRSHRDLLSYCGPWWISDYHFSRALRYRLWQEEARRSAADAAPARSILLWGGADADGAPFLEPVLVVDAPPGLPPSGTDYRLVGRDADGTEVFALSFDIPDLADGDGSSAFAFTLPVRSGWEDALATVTITGPGGAATLNRETDMPIAILRDPGTGQVRGFLRGLPAAFAGGRPGLEVLFSRGIPDAAAWRR